MATKMDIGGVRVCRTNSSYDASQFRGVIVRITRLDSKRYFVKTESWSRWKGETGEKSGRIFRSLLSAEAEAEASCRTELGGCEWSRE